MKIRKGFVIRKVGDQQYAVATSDALKHFKGMLKLNEMGAFIFTLLQEDVDTDMVVDRISECFDGDRNEIVADVIDFIEKLRSIDIIEE